MHYKNTCLWFNNKTNYCKKCMHCFNSYEVWTANSDEKWADTSLIWVWNHKYCVCAIHITHTALALWYIYAYLTTYSTVSGISLALQSIDSHLHPTTFYNYQLQCQEVQNIRAACVGWQFATITRPSPATHASCGATSNAPLLVEENTCIYA